MVNPLVKAWHAVKAATLRFGAGPWWGGWFVGSSGAYSYEQVDATTNSIVAACVRWMARTMPEAPLVVRERTSDGEWEDRPDHRLQELLDRPNPYYSGLHLWAATVADWMFGDAYWVKTRFPDGRVQQLWWMPSWMIEPKWEGRDFISYYKQRVDGEDVRWETKDVVHFRNGNDPRNPRKGLGLKAVIREVATDQEAAGWTVAMVHNVNPPGVVISPAADLAITEENAERVKSTFSARFSGERRGEPLVMGAATKVDILSYSPEQMKLTEIRRVPEERITAYLGIPAIVVGVGAGLDRSCVPASARVQTPTGTKTIAELEAGSVVWSFKDGRIVPRLVEHKWPARRDMVYEVRTSNRRLHLTGNHPLMVRIPGHSLSANDGRAPRYEWRHVDDLRVGDRIVYAKGYPDQGGATLPDGRIASTEMLQFLGAVIGDGTVSPGVGVRIAMPPTDRCVETYRALAGSLFSKYRAGGERPWKRAIDGNTERIVEMVAGGTSYHAIGRALDMNNATVRSRYLSATQPRQVVTVPVVIQERERDFGFSSADASRWLASLGVAGRAHTKRVPSWVYGLSRDLRLAFLAGIVDTDGYVDARGALTVVFCNRALLEDVRDLCIGLGIRCSNVGHRVLSPDVLPNPGRCEQYEAWSFCASSARQVGAIPFSDPLYRERVEANPDRHRGEGFDARKTDLSDDLGFAQIRSITPIGEDDVYDLTVEDGHSFFCENVLVSNTFANFSEAREAAYESCLIPTQRLFAADLNAQLVPEFGDPKKLRLAFDLSEVRVLQDDLNALSERVDRMVRVGIWTLNEGRLVMAGKPAPADPIDGGDVLMLPGAWAPTPPAHLAALAAAPAPELGPAPPQAGGGAAPDQPPTDQQQPPLAKALTLTTMKALSDAEIVARYEAGLAPLTGTLANDLLDAFEAIADTAAGRLAGLRFPANGKANGYATAVLDAKAGEAIGGLVTEADHQEIRSLLRSYVLKAMRQAAEDLAPLTDGPVRIQRNNPAVKAAIAEMEARLPGIVETTGEDFGRLVRRLERRPGSVPLADIQQALRDYVVESYPSRAEMIARTELNYGHAAGVLLVAEKSGIADRVHVHDGDQSDAICANRNGSVVTLEEAHGIGLAHPRCVMRLVPVLEAP